MKEFFLFLWERYFKGARNVGYGHCRWNCYGYQPRQRILVDEGMCWACYEDYLVRFK